MKKKSLGMLTLSAILSFSLLAPTVSAINVTDQNSQEKIKIQVATVNNFVSKNDLVTRIKELFPGKFDFLSSDDFNMNSGHRFPEDDDDIVRYNLHFSKEVSGEHVNGEFEFIGEDLQLNRFYYNPVNKADSLFPPKVSRDDAQIIADEFLSKLSISDEYKFSRNNIYRNRTNQTLTEPIRYDFSYEKYKNGVPISDQNVNIAVLGNGELISFNGPYKYYQNRNFVYEDANKAKATEDVLSQIKENFSVDLQYLVDFDYNTKETNVRLAYLPFPSVNGVHAITGDWMVRNNFVDTVPNSRALSMLVEEPLQPKYSSFSIDDAKALAESLLNVDNVEGVKLNIEGIDERTNHQGKEVISVNYMYFMGNSGTGTNFEIDRNTGAILQFHDLKEQILKDYGKEQEPTKELSYDDALKLAVEYAKEYAPSYLHHFSYPTVETTLGDNGYNFLFPRVKNGLIVSNQGLNVGISSNGSLNSFRVNLFEIDQWPSKENAVSEEEVIKEYLNNLKIELRYLNNNYWETKSNQYNLVYMLKYHEDHQFIDAVTGDWDGFYNRQEEEKPVVSDHWAEEELNFMISAGIIKVNDDIVFNPDAATTKGEAIAVLIKSLTRSYDYQYGREGQLPASFANIQADHRLYQVVEKAVHLGILDKDNKNFAIDEPLTRQELSVWYIRALGLEEAAKHSDIYKINFKDASLVKEDNKGYVALMNALGVLTTSNNLFRPDQEVTFGQLAVSSFRLAKLAANDDRFNRY